MYQKNGLEQSLRKRIPQITNQELINLPLAGFCVIPAEISSRMFSAAQAESGFPSGVSCVGAGQA